MSFLVNGDFSDGLNGWTVSQGGPTGPTHDAANDRVIFGTGDNDVQDGDRLTQEVSLVVGQEYTVNFSASELGSSFGGFGLNVEMVDVNGTGNTQFLQSVTVNNDSTTNISITFTSSFSNPVFQIRGSYGYGGVNSALILDGFSVTCFVKGTLISTPSGPIPIENLRPRDLVTTVDNGPKPVRWIGKREINLTSSDKWAEKLRPIRIGAGAIGHRLPKRDLLVSRQHRMLVSSKVAARMFDAQDVLISAARLTALRGVDVDQDLHKVTYFHILFDDHQIVLAEGAPSESLYLGPETMKTIPKAAREEILALFPEILNGQKAPKSACFIPTEKLQKQLIERHLKNQKPLIHAPTI